MSLFARDVDFAFQGAGAKVGLEIWCVENLRLVPIPKSSHGNFFFRKCICGIKYNILERWNPST